VLLACCEAANSESDPKAVQQGMKKLNKLSKEIAREHHEIAAGLGISS
jgi:hypothetical protein